MLVGSVCSLFFINNLQRLWKNNEKHVLRGWRGIYKALPTLSPYKGPQKGFNHFSRMSKKVSSCSAVLYNSGLQQLLSSLSVPWNTLANTCFLNSGNASRVDIIPICQCPVIPADCSTLIICVSDSSSVKLI